MIPELSTILLFVTSAVLLTIAPGPDNIYVAIRGLAQGWKAGVVAALGLVTGLIVHILLAALGLSAILASAPVLFAIIKYAGAAYILYVGWQIFKSGPIQISDDAPPSPLLAIYRQTIVMNILNPKVTLFFLAFMPQFVDTSSSFATEQFVFFGILFQIQALVIMGGIGIFAGVISSKFTASGMGQKILPKFAGSIVMALGAYIPLQDLWDLVLSEA
ncbi:MAG: LysE family translocator [Sneathiella sp.]|nr:LysE family translocator [Sneathiella sp.]